MLSGQNSVVGNWHPGQLDAGFLGLFIVQFVGVCLALRLTSKIPDLYGVNISSGVHLQMRLAVWGLLAVTIAGAGVQGDLLRLVSFGFGAAPKGQKPNPRNLEVALVVYFLADFVAIAFLIYKTGGPDHSIYTTFLYVLVPITIAFQQRVSARTVTAFALLTIFVFLATLWLPELLAASTTPSNFGDTAELMASNTILGGTSFESSDVRTPKQMRRCWMSAITIACVLFPTVIYLMQRRSAGCLNENGSGEGDSEPRAPEADRSIGVSAGPRGPGDLADRISMSDVGDE